MTLHLLNDDFQALLSWGVYLQNKVPEMGLLQSIHSSLKTNFFR